MKIAVIMTTFSWNGLRSDTMLQTYTDFDQAEQENITRAQEENVALRQTLQDIYRCAYKWDWHTYSLDTPEGYVYRRVREGLK
jgi:hypothetical protein